ncbi:conserved hypothetical protein [Ricinus communis]|uniref:Uncharacterized protein n=1 Tax=Ricinus communis TaxID=3988 RepID=B9SUR6_RICCO|nr:conserved hypothetical protein [Ricinus communis]
MAGNNLKSEDIVLKDYIKKLKIWPGSLKSISRKDFMNTSLESSHKREIIKDVTIEEASQDQLAIVAQSKDWYLAPKASILGFQRQDLPQEDIWRQ